MKTYAEYAAVRNRLIAQGYVGAGGDNELVETAGDASLEEAIAFDDWANFHPEMVAVLSGSDVETLTLDDRFPDGLRRWEATLYAQLYERASSGSAPAWVYQMLLVIADRPHNRPAPSNPYIRR